MGTFKNGGTVWAGFRSPDGGDEFIASATVSWNDSLYVTISNPTYSTSASCKWRVRPFAGGSPLAGYNGDNYLGNTFYATANTQYVFQACVAGPGAWGNSTVAEGQDGSSYFTVTTTYVPPDPLETYTITYDAMGGDGAPATHYKTEGQAVYLSSVTPTKGNVDWGSYTITFDTCLGYCDVHASSAKITKSYDFWHWNTSSSGSGTRYAPGVLYSYDANLALYAMYTENIETESIMLPEATRDGYEFLGWSTDSGSTSGMTGSYTPTGETESITLYAIWGAKGFIYLYDGSEFSPYQIFIYDGASWDMYCPYVYDDEWSMCS